MTTEEIIAAARASQKRMAYRNQRTYSQPTTHRAKMHRKGLTRAGKVIGAGLLAVSAAFTAIGVVTTENTPFVSTGDQGKSAYTVAVRTIPTTDELNTLRQAQNASETPCWLEYHAEDGGWFEPVCAPAN